MPIYEYACSKCKKHHEIMQKITETPLTICPKCGGDMKKLISSTSFVLKGTGWYATDYASSKTKDSGEKKEKKPLDLKSELKKDKKTEKKSESKESKTSKE